MEIHCRQETGSLGEGTEPLSLSVKNMQLSNILISIKEALVSTNNITPIVKVKREQRIFRSGGPDFKEFIAPSIFQILVSSLSYLGLIVNRLPQQS